MVTITYEDGGTEKFATLQELAEKVAYDDYLLAKMKWAKKYGTFTEL